MPKTRYVRQAKKECSLDREAASQSRSTSPTISIDRKIHKSPFAVDPSSPMPLTEAQMTAEIKERILRFPTENSWKQKFMIESTESF